MEREREFFSQKRCSNGVLRGERCRTGGIFLDLGIIFNIVFIRGGQSRRCFDISPEICNLSLLFTLYDERLLVFFKWFLSLFEFEKF